MNEPINIFRRIDAMIEHGRIHMGQTEFRWTLPRHCGATTWIFNSVHRDLKAGLKVGVVGSRRLSDMIRADVLLDEFVKSNQLTVIPEGGRWNYRGHRFDRIYGDNVAYFSLVDRLRIRTHILPCVDPTGYSVFINTTEGEL